MTHQQQQKSDKVVLLCIGT